jgi:hypothetical protein
MAPARYGALNRGELRGRGLPCFPFTPREALEASRAPPGGPAMERHSVYALLHSAEPGILGGSRIWVNLLSAMESAKARMTNRCTREPG